MEKYIDNIMFYPSIVLMVVEVAAVVYLIRSWREAKREQREREREQEEQDG